MLAHLGDRLGASRRVGVDPALAEPGVTGAAGAAGAATADRPAAATTAAGAAGAATADSPAVATTADSPAGAATADSPAVATTADSPAAATTAAGAAGAATADSPAVATTADRPAVASAPETPGAEIERVTDLEALAPDTPPFELVLLLDVLEHVADEARLLRQAAGRLAPGGQLLVTVPAFEALYSAHDEFLGHHRRYRRRALTRRVRTAGLVPRQSGYLFGSLLAPRLLSVLAQRCGWRPTPRGVGAWQRGPTLSATITLALRADNRVLSSLSRRDLHLPGLTTWVRCEKTSPLPRPSTSRLPRP